MDSLMNFLSALFGIESPVRHKPRRATMTATATRAAGRKATARVDITKLNNRQIDQLDEATLLASVSPKLKKIYLMAKPLRGKLTKAIEAE